MHRVTDCLTKINNKRGSTSSESVQGSFFAPHTKEPEKKLLQYHEKCTEVHARTAELYSEQRNSDLMELMVTDEMTECKVCKKTHAEGKSLAHVEYFKRNSQCKKAERNNGASDDSPRRSAAANQDKRSDTTPQSRK